MVQNSMRFNFLFSHAVLFIEEDYLKLRNAFSVTILYCSLFLQKIKQTASEFIIWEIKCSQNSPYCPNQKKQSGFIFNPQKFDCGFIISAVASIIYYLVIVITVIRNTNTIISCNSLVNRQTKKKRLIVKIAFFYKKINNENYTWMDNINKEYYYFLSQKY